MRRFADLMDRLVYTPGRNAKLRLLAAYFRTAPDPDRGYGLAALTDGFDFRLPVRRTLAELMEKRLDPELYRLSRDYVGDTAETVALVWPEPAEPIGEPPALSQVIAGLESTSRLALAPQLEDWLDRLDGTGRWALLKLLTGAPRVGVSARLAKTAVAELGGVPVEEIEEVWHGLSPPYVELFAWLEGRAPRPDAAGAPAFRPPMLAHPLQAADLAALDPAEYAAEWKWDGIRVQIASGRGMTRLYSRTGEDIGASFPEIVEAFRGDIVLDGELLVVRRGEVAPFNDLQQRLNRRAVTRRMLLDHPAHVRLYDALVLDGEDLRSYSFDDRRRHLAEWHARTRPPLSDLSEVLPVPTREELSRVWEGTRGIGIEGLMLKRRASPYLAGRVKGHWWKWKRAPLSADCVLMYAQRGSGKRSSYYSDYTFGAWTGAEDGSRLLVPVGKAYSGYTDAELLEVDRFVRTNTIERFGPVRQVAPRLVLEIVFDAVQRSTRHRSGIAMRFPRINRIRWDKPAAEADELSTLISLIES